jgi:nucleotide-binding universal stress UspA family protein
MYRRILLAYDGTLEGRAALREGALLARRCGAEVFLLAVVSTDATATAMGGTSAAIMQDHSEIFEEGLARAKEFGLKADGKLVSGDPVYEIRTYAEELPVDLVVVGLRKKTLLERWWSGPTHAFLSDSLQCSLLISRNLISDEELRAELQVPSGAPAPLDA